MSNTNGASISSTLHSICPVCNKRKPFLIRNHCEQCFRDYYLKPYDKQITQAKETLSSLENNRLELVREIADAREESHQTDFTTHGRSVVSYVCHYCFGFFAYQSEHIKHEATCTKNPAHKKPRTPSKSKTPTPVAQQRTTAQNMIAKRQQQNR